MLRHLPLALVLLTTPILAEPSPSISYLMNEPVSMLDWGIYRLQSLIEYQGVIEAPVETFQKQICLVLYDWDTNRLRLSFMIYPRFRSLQKTPAKQVCSSIVMRIRQIFGCAPGWESTRRITGIGTHFHHRFYEKKDYPETLDRDIEAITYIDVRVNGSRTGQAPFDQAVSCACEGSLLGPEIRYVTTEIKK